MNSFIYSKIQEYENIEYHSDIQEVIDFEINELLLVNCIHCFRKDYKNMMVSNLPCNCCNICYDCYDLIEKEQIKIKEIMVYNLEIYKNFNNIKLGYILKCGKILYPIQINELDISFLD